MEDLTQAMENISMEDDDSLHVASKCWERVMNAASKTGYREGVQDGADSVLQEGFDIGFRDGFQTAFVLGRCKSLATVLPPNLKHPEDITAVLDKSRRGACHICSLESQSGTSNIHNVPFSEVLSDQRTHSATVINRLQEYFKPILDKSGIEINLSI